jgi:hypothetical protein
MVARPCVRESATRELLLTFAKRAEQGGTAKSRRKRAWIFGCQIKKLIFVDRRRVRLLSGFCRLFEAGEALEKPLKEQ